MTAAEKRELEQEIARLEGPRRAEIVEAIATARGHGDLSENFEYHAAKHEQGLLEARIRSLRAKLDSVVLVDESAAAGDRVSVGSRVVIADEDQEEIAVVISNAGGEGAVSPDSP